MAFESMYNFTALDISPNGCLLVAVNEKGHAYMISMISQTVIHKYKFSTEVKCIRFSPNGKYFAACKEDYLMVFKTPGAEYTEYGSFMVHHVFRTTSDGTTWLDWSEDSRLIAVGCNDNYTRVFAIGYYKNYRPYRLSGHTHQIVSSFFESDTYDLNTISKNGQLCLWQCNIKPEELTIKIEKDDEEDETEKAAKVQEEDDEPKGKRLRADSSDEPDEDDAEFEDPVETELGPEDRAIEAEDEDYDDTKPERDDQGKVIVQQQKTKPRHPFFYTKQGRYYLCDEPRKENRSAMLTAASYHKKSKILIVSFSTGAFYLYELPSVTIIHSLSISEYSIVTCCFNNTGDWVALGVAGVGQLLVWEWQSEQYIMKQQGHSSELNSIAYSPDGQLIATAGADAKIKLWNVLNGFCFVTFTEHTASVTGLQFSNSKKFVVSASLDGTVRAFDIIRYRNFKTFLSPRPVQFACVALDHSGELVAAGGQDVYEIFLWSVKFGHLLEVLSGHEAPVSSIAFAQIPTSSTMVSVSWDKTLKIWDCIEKSTVNETVDLLSDALCVAFKPDGEEVAVATLNGNISIFNVKTTQQVASIEGRNDLGSGVSDIDLVSAKKNLEGKAFTTLTYSADGECILAAGKSKHVCIYHVYEAILLKKFVITQNHSLDGMWDFINRKAFTEFGNMNLIQDAQEELGEGEKAVTPLPGVQKGDFASRKTKPEVRVFSVQFSPSAQSWAAATTEGLLIYSLEKGVVFDPYYLSLEVTPKTIRECLKAEEYSTALVLALKLNEVKLIQEVIEQIPHNQSKFDLITSHSI